MSKNVLALSSSPRKGGNSDLLCDQFLSGAQEAGHRAEKIFLKDQRIEYCTGCGACFNGAKSCVQNDDMAEILEKMIAADVIALATPVYFYTMCAQMKTLIDRTCSRYAEIKDKEFYFIATAAEDEKETLHGTLEGLRLFIDCLDGSKEKGVIHGTGLWESGAVKDGDLLKQAYEMGKAV